MVTQTAEHQPHYDTDNYGEWDGQLPAADIIDQLPPPTERKPGGPMDRSTWIAMSMPHLSGAGFKFLSGLNVYANTEGRCWPSHTTLRRITGLSESGVRNGQREAVKGGWIEIEINGQGRHSATYRLTGWQSEWKELPKAKQLLSAGLPRKDCGAEGSKSNYRTPSSSNPTNEPKDTNKEATSVAATVGKEGDTTGAFSSFSFEEEGVREYEETGIPPTANVKDTTELTNSARAAACSDEDVAAWVAGHVSELPADSEIEALGKHCWPVWEKHFKTVDFAGALVVWKGDRAKFRRDLPRHLVKVGIPKPIGRTDEDIRAQQVAGSRLDVAVGKRRRVALTHCQGCKLKRHLPTGQTHCYDCRRGELEHPHQIAGWTCKACGEKMTPETRATECAWRAQA